MEQIDVKVLKTEMKLLSNEQHTEIIKIARRINKIQKKIIEFDMKIAVLGTCSIQYFVMVLRAYLLKYDITAQIYEGQYDGINMDVFDNESELYKFNPNVVIVLSDYRDIQNVSLLLSDPQEIDDYVSKQGTYYRELWDKLSDISGCHIFQTNIVTPLERILGNLEANFYFSRKNMYHLINIEMIKQKTSNVTIVDMEYMAECIGKNNWFDNKSYFMSKMGFSLNYIGIVCDVFAQQIAALRGKIKKCLVLDLDNTLWGGVVADEGVEGIRIEPNNAEGEAYLAFQKYILQLKERGVILAVISKNDYDIAKEPFEKNENMILKFNDFSAFIANWDNKAQNIDVVAQELNIGSDSFVFFDDNPAEREIVKMYHPEVTVIEVPENVAEYVTALEKAHPFEWLNITEEDISRTASYTSNRERKDLFVQFQDYQQYLKALKMESQIRCLEEKNIERFTQLINKSNQFNLRTQRYSEAEINDMLRSSKYKLLAITLKDKFSNFGIISCIILKKQNNDCFIDTWVMSCRVLKRDVEKLAFNAIVREACEWGCKAIKGEYIPTVKNSLVKKLFENLEFVEQEIGNKDENKRYLYDVKKGIQKNIMIKEI